MLIGLCFFERNAMRVRPGILASFRALKTEDPAGAGFGIQKANYRISSPKRFRPCDPFIPH